MPPRFTYWTIILEGKPTAFRASTQEELLPTFNRLKSKHPDTLMMWFARGRLWKSEEEAKEAFHARKRARAPEGQERRGPDWRPGGKHEDPRKRFEIPRDEKRRRFRDRLYRDRNEQQQGDRPPSGDRGPRSEGPRPDRPAGPRPDRPPRPEWKPKGPPRPREGDRREWKPNRPPGSRPERPQWKRDRPAGPPKGPSENRWRGPSRKPGDGGRGPGPGRKPGGPGRKPGGGGGGGRSGGGGRGGGGGFGGPRGGSSR
jgi:translation initiation factor IF-2